MRAVFLACTLMLLAGCSSAASDRSNVTMCAPPLGHLTVRWAGGALSVAASGAECGTVTAK